MRSPSRCGSRATATASAASVALARGRRPAPTRTPGSFHIVDREDRLKCWKPQDGGEKWFCGDCGSSIFARNLSHPDAIGIRMGTFDTDPGIRPSVRAFVADAAAWEPIPDDGLPRHSHSRHATP
jgi:Glutathione-dependent formaldehyde-activating enzyme